MDQLSTTEEDSLNYYHDELSNLMEEIMLRDSAIISEPDSATTAQLLAEKDSLLQLLGNQTIVWNYFHQQLEANRITAAGQVEIDNSKITTTAVYETNEKTVNDIYLNSFAVGEDLDSTEIAILSGVANQCPLEGGAAVHRARALIGAANYDDYQICLTAVNRNEENTTQREIIEFSIVPNPVEDQLHLVLPDDVRSVQITNQLGQVLHIWEGLDFTTRWHTSLGLSGGLYYCTVETNRNRSTRPFIVIKK